jgi:hypothetical protein
VRSFKQRIKVNFIARYWIGLGAWCFESFQIVKTNKGIDAYIFVQVDV